METFQVNTEIAQIEANDVVHANGGHTGPAVTTDVDAERGSREGRRWALCRATVPQLAVLASLAAEYEAEEVDSDDPTRELSGWLAVNLAGVYGAEVEGTKPLFPPNGPRHSSAFLKAFVRAATATWKECIKPIDWA